MNRQVKQILAIAKRFSTQKNTPLCSYAGICGGCLLQDYDYEAQCAIKKEYVNTVLQNIAVVDEVVPSHPIGYRNRMDFVTAFGKIGLRKLGNYRQVVDIQDCLLLQEKSRSVFKTIRENMGRVDDYNYLTHTGYLRYVVLRQGFNTSQIMVNFVVAREYNNLSHIIASLYDSVDSISLIVNDGLADVSYGRIFEVVKKGFIEETLDKWVYRITPNSFFQSNTAITQHIYTEIAAHAYGRVLDLYCGVGSIGIYIASNVENVIGVEVNNEAIAIAKENAAINCIQNIQFIEADAVEFLKADACDCNVIVVDPPRTGLGAKVVSALVRSNAERIIYMSCNPATFAEDAKGLTTSYTLKWCKAYDMFPQTPHVELLAVFDKT